MGYETGMGKVRGNDNLFGLLRLMSPRTHSFMNRHKFYYNGFIRL